MAIRAQIDILGGLMRLAIARKKLDFQILTIRQIVLRRLNSHPSGEIKRAESKLAHGSPKAL